MPLQADAVPIVISECYNYFMSELPSVEYLESPELKKFTREIPAGEYLFRQGEFGKTMFIICDGTVWLIAERDESEHVAAVLERGQFLGEKPVMSGEAHKRLFSARAKTTVTVLELGLADINKIEQTTPLIMLELLKRMFWLAASRLERQNHLTQLLRSSDEATRFVHLIIWLSHNSSRKVSGGIEFIMTPDSIHHYTDMPRERVTLSIQELVRRSLIKPVVDNYYWLKDEKALIAAIPDLRDFLQSKQAISEGPPRRTRLFGRP